jgi:DNA recombination protein RmuC
MILLLSIFVNLLLISGLLYILKQNRQSHKQFENLKQELSQLNSIIAVNEEKIFSKSNECQKYQNHINELTEKKAIIDKNLAENIAYLNSTKDILENINNKNKELESINKKLHEDYQRSTIFNAQNEQKIKNLQEKLDLQKIEIEQMQKSFQANFENLANKILHEKSEKFTEINKKNIAQILEPLGQNISNFKKQVADTYDKDSKERLVLQEQIKIYLNIPTKLVPRQIIWQVH